MSKCLVIDGKYPLNVSPAEFGGPTLIWVLMVFIFWLMSSLNGKGNFALSLLVAFVPVIGLGIYEWNRYRQWGWIIKPVLNVMRSAKMVQESRPLYRTIFGYNRIEAAPIFYLNQKAEHEYLLTFEPNGCPNANQKLLPFLQTELPEYEVIPQGSIRQQFLIRRRGRKGRRLTDADFH